MRGKAQTELFTNTGQKSFCLPFSGMGLGDASPLDIVNFFVNTLTSLAMLVFFILQYSPSTYIAEAPNQGIESQFQDSWIPHSEQMSTHPHVFTSDMVSIPAQQLLGEPYGVNGDADDLVVPEDPSENQGTNIDLMNPTPPPNLGSESSLLSDCSPNNEGAATNPHDTLDIDSTSVHPLLGASGDNNESADVTVDPGNPHDNAFRGARRRSGTQHKPKRPLHLDPHSMSTKTKVRCAKDEVRLVAWNICGRMDIATRIAKTFRYDFLFFTECVKPTQRNFEKPKVNLLVSDRGRKMIKFQIYLSQRILKVSTTFGVIYGVYSPTSKDPDLQNELLSRISADILRTASSDSIFVIGDLNAQVGRSALEKLCGRWLPTRETNDSGTRLLNFCFAHDLAISNSFFKQPRKHLATYRPSSSVASWRTLDYLLTNEHVKVRNAFVAWGPSMRRFGRARDHGALTIDLVLPKVLPRLPGCRDFPDWSPLKSSEHLERFGRSLSMIEPPMNLTPALEYQFMICEARKLGLQLFGRRRPYRHRLVEPFISKETYEIMSLRRQASAEEARVYQKKLSKAIQRDIKDGLIKEVEGVARTEGNSFWKLLKPLRSTLAGHMQMAPKDLQLFGRRKFNGDDHQIAEGNFEVDQTFADLVYENLAPKKTALGPDMVPAEVARFPSIFRPLIQALSCPSKLPPILTDCRFHPIPKPGTGDFRLIALKTQTSKAVEKAIRVTNGATLDILKGARQYGGVSGRSTTNCIYILARALANAIPPMPCEGTPRVDESEEAFLFVDIEKAFPSVPHRVVVQELQEHLPDLHYELLMALQKGNGYIGQNPDLKFPLLTGIREGSPLSTDIFCVIFEAAVRRTLQKTGLEGVNNVEDLVKYLLFVDDAVFYGSPKNLAKFLEAFTTECNQIGLNFSLKKGKSNFMIPSHPKDKPPTANTKAVELANKSEVACRLCLRKFPSSKSLPCHLKRWCKGSPEAEEARPRKRYGQRVYKDSEPPDSLFEEWLKLSEDFSHKCPDCDTKFKTMVGLNIHRARSRTRIGGCAPPKCRIYQGSTGKLVKRHALPTPEGDLGGGVQFCRSYVYLGVLLTDDANWRDSIEHRYMIAGRTISSLWKLRKVNFAAWTWPQKWRLFQAVVLPSFRYGLVALPLSPEDVKHAGRLARKLAARYLQVKMNGEPFFGTRNAYNVEEAKAFMEKAEESVEDILLLGIPDGLIA